MERMSSLLTSATSLQHAGKKDSMKLHIVVMSC